MSIELQQISACFQGIIPSILSTCGKDGEPNVTYLSQVYLVDTSHVALSCQFFNKTKRNVAENPYATVIVYHPVTYQAYRLRLHFVRSEFNGPLFETMAVRIDVIASHSGMTGIFKLISSDVYEVLGVEEVEGFLLPADPVLDAPTVPLPSGPLTELRGVQVVSQRIASAHDLESLLSDALLALDELLGFSFSMILVPDESNALLVALATHGYPAGGVGSEVRWGYGTIGAAAERRRMVKVTGMAGDLRYGKAIRDRIEECGELDRLSPEIPLPGLPDAQAQLALPLLAHDHLVGILAVESRDPLCFDEWDEAYLQILANQIAMGMDRLQSDDEDAFTQPQDKESVTAPPTRPRLQFLYYRCDDCVFVDGEYLIRNVPARILWKVLTLHRQEGRIEFTNRELRLDPSLGLPPLKDNLESRLILLRKRLAEKCPSVSLIPVKRGRFALAVDADVELTEKEHA